MTTIYAIMPMKDESSRYLQACLKWLKPLVDEVFVYDDQSSDDSVAVTLSEGCRVIIRDPTAPSFLEHEGRFRLNLWKSFEDQLKPDKGDWVLALDADEFLVGGSEGQESCKDLLHTICRTTLEQGVILPIPEIFGRDELGFLVRVDGFWGSIRGPRLFKYQPNGLFSNKSMGSGSEPTYLLDAPLSFNNNGLYLMHAGYLNSVDRQIKYQRYSRLLDHGHNDRHVASIVKEPNLARWEGPSPLIWSGVK